ncbi:hypothetical protein FMEAI12_4430002 [Parafrankia sp. Ea1.12]|nr:hypothetical protein FMEAI12_4430002 [Parafrankia sp. Ea1.12]
MPSPRPTSPTANPKPPTPTSLSAQRTKIQDRYSVVFANPSVPSTATVQVRCDVAGQRTYHPTSFLLRHPVVGQVLNVNLIA